MKINLQILLLCLVAVLTGTTMMAQPVFNESSSPTESGGTSEYIPRDGFYDKEIIRDRRLLTYDHIREADVFWEKRIWRIVDVREKMNKTFIWPENPFINILLGAATEGEIQLYSTLDDKFTTPLEISEVESMGSSRDTIVTFDPDTYEEQIRVVNNELNWEDIKRFRIKEIWFFDEETSTMQVRILGIAPLKEEYDDNGNFKFEYPMFWAYYPDCREILAREEAYNPLNDAQRMSWEDVMEMRFFDSYVWKESNVEDRRIQDYKAGVDILFEAEKIEESILSFEHDLWSY